MNRLWKRQHRKFDKGKRPSMYRVTTESCGSCSYIGTYAANRAARRETKRFAKAYERAEIMNKKDTKQIKKIHRQQGR